MIKLIASDIDGTLLEDGGHKLDPELLEVILRLKERGISFAAASGRQWKSIESLFAPIHDQILYISDNGALMGYHNERLVVNQVERSLVHQIICDMRQEGFEVMVSGADLVYMDSQNEALYDWVTKGYRFHVQKVPDLLQVEDDFIKITAYRPHGIDAATKHLRETYAGRLKMSVAGEMWMDCMAPCVSKGQALMQLQERLGVRPEETMVFGDQMNDVELLQQAYYSFAIGNAREEVKKLARFQADSNDKAGVLKILKCLL